MARGKKRESEELEAEMMDASSSEPEYDDEVSPVYKHNRKLAAQKKAAEATRAQPVSTKVEMAVSKFGRVKYRRVTRMSNGNAYSVVISKEDYDAAVKKGY